MLSMCDSFLSCVFMSICFRHTVTTFKSREEFRSRHIQILRSEMLCKLEDQRNEMELRLDMQRGHMIQRESALKGHIDELKAELARISQKVSFWLVLYSMSNQFSGVPICSEVSGNI